MIDRIYIPTVKRPEDQTTYSNLPEEYQKIVTMVVQDWEKDKYDYDVDYLVLPKELNLEDRYCLAKTRKLIHEHARGTRYATMDDDLDWKVRNSRYWTGESNMEKSSRFSDKEDIFNMFNTFESWMEEGVGVCGTMDCVVFPSDKQYVENKGVFACVFFDGPKFEHLLDDMELDMSRCSEDVVMLLHLYEQGIMGRTSNEFLHYNISFQKKNKVESVIWDSVTTEEINRDYAKIASRFPDVFSHTPAGEGEVGRGAYGKVRVSWSKAFKSPNQSSLEEFLS